MEPPPKKVFAPVPAQLLDTARELRQHMTDSERLLWSRLRRKQLGFRFRRQHPVGRYVLDFFCVEMKLAVELDGGQHGDSGTAAYDAERTAYLGREGIRVVRVWNHLLLENLEGVLQMILDELEEPAGQRKGKVPPP